MDKYRVYEQLKKKIYAESKSSAEYERRSGVFARRKSPWNKFARRIFPLKALARKLRI